MWEMVRSLFVPEIDFFICCVDCQLSFVLIQAASVKVIDSQLRSPPCAGPGQMVHWQAFGWHERPATQAEIKTPCRICCTLGHVLQRTRNDSPRSLQIDLQACQHRSLRCPRTKWSMRAHTFNQSCREQDISIVSTTRHEPIAAMMTKNFHCFLYISHLEERPCDECSTR